VTEILYADADVLYEVDSGVAVITFNRPHRSNALTLETSSLYRSLLLRAEEEDAVGAVVVTGAGDKFCAGGDLHTLATATPAEVSATATAWPEDFALRMSKPVIAAINGSVAGLGLVEALLCDVRFAAEDAPMTFAFSRHGLVAECGVSWLLPRLVGTGRALDLLWATRPFTGAEAHAYGLVEYIAPRDRVLADAVEYASNLVRTASSHSLAQMKRQVYADWSNSRVHAFAEANELMLASLHRDEFSELMTKLRGAAR
jgi:enoyl-CoA hydratase/carnithine racemase